MAENNRKDDFWKKKPKANRPSGPTKGPEPNHQMRFGLGYFAIVAIALFIINSFAANKNYEKEISFSDFKAKLISGEIKQVRISQGYMYGYTLNKEEAAKELEAAKENFFSPRKLGIGNNQNSAPTIYKAVILNVALLNDPALVPLLDERKVDYWAEPPKNNYFLYQIVPFIIFTAIIMLVWRSAIKRMGGGANVMNFGQNKSRIVAESDLNTRFADVAGCDEAKEELEEVVDFLKRPTRYTEIGGKIPKGALLVGPPGTGKTLLARAVAGEAGVTFFKMSGADFVEMFVGVGAARVRDLFQQARLKAPCIIFIDELDAIGKSRMGNISGNDEREQTLNQLLVEMDGFDSTTGVILLAATNRPEVLDPALLRPGRFDRQVMVDRPDVLGREAILKIHSKHVKLEKNIDLHDIAKATPGFVGADLANIVNEAALLAVRSGRKQVAREDFDNAIEKAALGLAKKNRVMKAYEKEMTAYHETGHALTTVFTEGVSTLRKVTIVPRGFSLGATWSNPIEGRYSKTTDEMIGDIDVLLGGRAAEETVYGKISTGAGNDIQRATDIARSMIMEYGMSERFKNVAFSRQKSVFLDGGTEKEYAESTQTYIDEEIARMMAERYSRVLNLLKKHRGLLDTISKELLEKENLSAEEFLAIVRADEAGRTDLEAAEATNNRE